MEKNVFSKYWTHLVNEPSVSKISINNAGNILTNVTLKFTRCYPDDSSDPEQGNAELVLGYSPACFLCALHSPSDDRVKNVPKRHALSSIRV